MSVRASICSQANYYPIASFHIALSGDRCSQEKHDILVAVLLTPLSFRACDDAQMAVVLWCISVL